MEKAFQLEIDAAVKTPKVTYEKDIVPILLKFLPHMMSGKLLDSYQPKTYNDREYNIILETMVYSIVFTPGIIKKISLNQELMMYKTYPYLIFNIQFMRNAGKQVEHIDKLLSLSNELFGEQHDKFYQNIMLLRDFASSYLDQYHTRSSIVNFNNLVGIGFAQTGISYDELPKGRKLFINAGFNNSKNNIIYRETKSIPGNFITEQSVKQNNPVESVKTILQKDCWYIEGPKHENAFIVINYNNDVDKHKCKYSVSYKSYSEHQIDVLCGGGVIMTMRNTTMKIYFAQRLYDRIYLTAGLHNPADNQKELKDKLSDLSLLIKKYYNTDVKMTLKNWKQYEPDNLFFHTWLNKLDDFVINGVLDYSNYVQTVNNFYLPPDV